ncbi:MAG: hypothetical protein ACRD9R_11085 [Pyrinomonadaceae bacterium]
MQQAQSRVQRQPLEKQQREYKTPTNYEPHERGYDPKTGKTITYDHQPRVELVDAKAGKYAFKWIGVDGKEKTVIFQRADAIDVVVSATVSKTTEGKYHYNYEVQNLPSSGTYLSGFIVQNFVSDVKLDNKGGMFTGAMSNAIYEFREGNWIHFADASDDLQLDPGQTVKLQLTSSAPPGLVGCRAVGGELSLEGVGEDMPLALERLLPGYEEFPKGRTIGPVDSLQTLSLAEEAKYLLDNLPQFRKLGWMTDAALSRYEQRLKSGDLEAVRKRLEQNLKDEQITTEVFAIIEAMK